MKHIKNCVATFFYCGYAPKAPGTFGTLGAVILYFLLTKFFFHTNPSYTFPTMLILLLLASIGNVWIGPWAENHFHKKDPKQVVIDEVAGYFLTVLFFQPTWELMLIAFCLFRLFDITKPYPIHKVEKLPQGWGILMDDLVAACYAIVVLIGLSYFQILNIKFITFIK